MAIQDIIDGVTREWNAGNGKGWASYFAPDVTFVDVLGRVQEGTGVVATEHQKIFDTIYKNSKVKFTLTHHKKLNDGIEVGVTFCVLNVPTGPRAGDFKCVQTMTVKDGKIVAFQNTGLADMSDFSKNDEELAKLNPLATRKEV